MIGRVMWVTWVVYITILPTVICRQEISGGRNATKNEFPYIARLYIRGFLCGASLIGDKYLATAAHCICPKFPKCRSASAINKVFDDNCKNQRNKCVAFIRDHDTDITDIGEKMIDIRRIHLKPGRYIDFLIVELVKSVNLDKRASIIPISQSAVKIGQKVITAGWGMVAHGKKSPRILQTTALEVAHVRSGFVWTKVDYDNGVPIDPCAGDSGGPLVIREANGDKLVGTLIGGGYNCIKDISDGYGLWTDTAYHYDWINNVTTSERKCDGSTPGQQIKGGNIEGKRTNTQAECTEWCRTTPWCQMWLWHPHGNYARSCRIHGQGWFVERQGQDDVVSGRCA